MMNWGSIFHENYTRGAGSQEWMSSPLYINSTKSEAFCRSLGMKTIHDFWLPANTTHSIQDVQPLLKVGVTQLAKYFSEECRCYT